MRGHYCFYMLAFFSVARLHRIAFFFCACIIVSIFLANWLRVALGIAMGGLAVTGVVYALVHKHIANRALWPVFGSIATLFGLHLLAGLHTEAANMDEYRFDLGMQLPLLMLPLAFWLLPPLPGRYLRGLWLLLIGVTTLAAVGATINYAFHAAEINESYYRSKVMPTEPDHIRFSLLITLAVAAGVLLLEHRAVRASWRPWLIGALVSLVLFLHMLAVRSGEMTFYALGGLAVLYLVLRKRQWKRAGALALVLLLLPVFSYVAFPTFRNKISNTKTDVSKAQQKTSDEGKKFSISGRLYSYKAALNVWEDNKLFGVGKPDLESEMAIRYAETYPEMTSEYYILPHNQYLYNLASYGIVGLIVFCWGLFYPVWWARRKCAPLLLAQYVSVALSFLVEYTLETQIGLAFVVFFLLLALQGSLPTDDSDPIWRPA
ncbi:O-antigen ligase family protein [Hymenobacter properus]|uniref:O-antigen ligase family protein n=1 Tax=Hymenobacter properus TaxID=2791026 RepID=A0A931BDZ5_9BACT|nr:O-antigen ligase family protein [Hymenobacter properus]MBF9141664.1 O-antigen ligase family protein [Hymenobacter properus]MBR7720473.1 O-antigen ligase family protein [Microvirga sp. SRT04]